MSLLDSRQRGWKHWWQGTQTVANGDQADRPETTRAPTAWDCVRIRHLDQKNACDLLMPKGIIQSHRLRLDRKITKLYKAMGSNKQRGKNKATDREVAL